MVPSQEEDRVREVDLYCVQQYDDFDGEGAAVDEIAEEEVLGSFWVASDFEEFK